MPRPSSEGAVRDGGVRKRMRKGTHSCFECRRRKIRCIYTDEHPNECTECFARGSRCIDQEHADPETIVDNRKNLRERVAKLEALIESLLDDRTATGAAETLRNLGADVLPPTPRSDSSAATPHRASAPFVVNSAAVSAQKADEPVPRAPTAQVYNFPGLQLSCECDDIGIPKAKKSKDKRTCETLLSILPSKEVFEQVIISNDEWWRMWRHHITASAANSSLQQYASQAIEKGMPAEVGVLLLCISIALDQDTLNNTLALVDALIISDDEYAATIEGIHCALLVAKCYAEIGQPRRAWLATRKGLTYAQLIGLHRTHSSNQDWDGIWWTLYQMDRFLSLLIGLPYAISDTLCDMKFYPKDTDSIRQSNFMLKISVLAGKIIDRTQSAHELSLAAALEIDQELDTVVESMPAAWWDPQAHLIGILDSVQCLKLRERILAQIGFHQLRVYLHLPFMLKYASAANASKYEYNRTACFGACREILTLYHLVRGGGGQPLYECKVMDFLGFTSAVLIMLGLLGYAKVNADGTGSYPNTVEAERDWRLIEITMDIFGRASAERGGKVASQSLKVLQQLASVKNGEVSEDTETNQKIVIPYFGSISLRRGKQLRQTANKQNNNPASTENGKNSAPFEAAAADGHTMTPPINAQQQSYFPSPTQTHNQNSTASSVCGEANSQANPYIACDPFLFPGSWDQNAWAPGEEGLDSLISNSHGGSWHNLAAANMDIDQDWTWFMGGSQTGSGQLPP